MLSGAIYALLDAGEVLLEAGDVLIQRGTNHAWSNRSNEPATLAFVLIDAASVGLPPARPEPAHPLLDHAPHAQSAAAPGMNFRFLT